MFESLVGLGSITALIGVAAAWRVRRRRAEQRWLAALDAYAERQLVREKQLRTLRRPRTVSAAAVSVANRVPRRVRTKLLNSY
jgi:hypothetical protein